MSRLSAGLAVGTLISLLALPSARALGSKDAGSATRGPEDPGQTAAPPVLGSGDLPILLEGVEVRTIREWESTTRDHMELHLGTWAASMVGLSGAERSAGIDLGGSGATNLDPETDTLAGVGLEVPTGVPESAFLQGGIATLRDPIDVAVSGVAATESWTTRAGLLIRF